MKKTTLLAIVLALIGLMLSGRSWALSTERMQEPELSVRLLSQNDATGSGKELLLGLDVTLADGVHTYWRNPGVAGAPPTLDWAGSVNLKEPMLQYPAPTRMSVQGMDTIGYEEHVLFPIRAEIENVGQPVTVKLALDILVCKELCTPKHFDLALDIPSGTGAQGIEGEELRKALSKVPTGPAISALKITNFTRTENKVYVEIASDHDIIAPDMFIETESALPFKKPEVTIDPSLRKAFLVTELDGKMPTGQFLTQTPLNITVVCEGHAVEQRLSQDGAITVSDEPPLASQQKTETAQSAPSLLLMVLFALLGGLILNLMPCVLPVLSLKIFSVVKHGGSEHDHIRQSFLATASGIFVSFLLLAGATLLIKAGGNALGWGMQFQQPTFLVFMITLLTLFAANLWGFFEITLPRFIMDTVGETHHPKLAGDFATGMLATLLATPCSAPFLGTAVGFALAAGTTEIIAIFAALGLGMAAPYLLVAIQPRIASAFPKPGSWMTILTRLLGFGMAGTAVWLLFVLHEQVGRDLTILITLGMIAILFQLFLRHKNIFRWLTIPVILLVFGGAFFIGLAATVPEKVAHDSGVWQKFDEASMNRAVREGKTVFVDITADWCITCKANKRFTLSRDEITEKLFDNPNVVAMQGDWTNPDPVITAFLHKHGRYGIPFNAVFGPKAPGGILLPEILTPSAVLEAIDHAKGPSKACPVDLPAGKDC